MYAHFALCKIFGGFIMFHQIFVEDPKMTPYERFETALVKLEEPDYVPTFQMAGIWVRHLVGERFIPIKEFATNPEALAEGLEIYQKATGNDCFYTLCDMAESSEGWGVPVELNVEEWIQPYMKSYDVVKEPSEWDQIEVIDPQKAGRMYLYTKAVEILAKKYKGTVPIIMEVPSPITVATYLGGLENVMMWIITDPEPLKRGIQTIAKTLVEWVKVAKDAGVDYVCNCETRSAKEIMMADQYKEFGDPFDRYLVSNSPKDVRFFIHACGEDPMIEEIHVPQCKDLPNMCGVNYWDRGPKTPNLKEAKEKWGKYTCFIAGLDQTFFNTRNIQEVMDEVKDAMDQAKAGGGFIISTGCDMPTNTPIENEIAWYYAVRKYGKY
jgi:uroporphyrinogen decarboxylase